MKELYYYQDSMMREFSADVVRTGTDNIGDYVVLSNTAFYPTGGGQPHDTGWIGGLEVINVEKMEKEIRHYINRDVEGIAGTVTGKLDWTRRFDHMQQHTGQHILTAAFVELFGYQTVSFHLGAELVAIDLNTTEVTAEQLAVAEKRANDIILENRPIETKWVTKEELAQYNLRKDVTVDDDIRLVIIPDYDYNGCGGTHPTSIGQVQMIKIMETEKMKSNIRIHFVCGDRVRAQLAMRKNVLTDVARQLSVPEREAGAALTKVMQTSKQADKALAEARDALLAYEAKDLAGQGESVISQAYQNRTIQELQKLARFIVTTNPQAVALLVANNADKLQFVAARGANLAVSMKEISGKVLQLINGKGGGNDALAQGGGEKIISPEDLLEEMKKALAN